MNNHVGWEDDLFMPCTVKHFNNMIFVLPNSHEKHPIIPRECKIWGIFVEFNLDSYLAPTTTMLCVMSCYIEPLKSALDYNSSKISHFSYFRSVQLMLMFYMVSHGFEIFANFPENRGSLCFVCFVGLSLIKQNTCPYLVQTIISCCILW